MSVCPARGGSSNERGEGQAPRHISEVRWTDCSGELRTENGVWINPSVKDLGAQVNLNAFNKKS